MSAVKQKLDEFAEKVLRRARFYGLYRYRARFVGVPPVKPDLVPLNQELGLPTLKASELTFGTPGMSGRITNRTLVVVAFEGGNPNAAFVHSFIDGEAYDLTIEVNQALTVRGTLSPSTSPVMLFDGFNAWLGAFAAHMSAVQSWMVAATPLVEPAPGGPLAAALTATGTTRSALSTAGTTVVQDYPAGAKSTKIRGA